MSEEKYSNGIFVLLTRRSFLVAIKQLLSPLYKKNIFKRNTMNFHSGKEKTSPFFNINDYGGRDPIFIYINLFIVDFHKFSHFAFASYMVQFTQFFFLHHIFLHCFLFPKIIVAVPYLGSKFSFIQKRFFLFCCPTKK